MERSSWHQVACGLMLFLGAIGPTWASTFQVTPVKVTLSADKPVAALTVRNLGAHPTVIQLQVLSWSQPAGNDRYAPAPDMLATPPIFTLPANGSQVIRVGFRRPPDAKGEQDFRLFLREIPPPLQPGFKGLRMSLRISLPVFIQPVAPVAPDLHWQAVLGGNGHLQIRVTNNGLAHAKLSGFRLSENGGAGSLPMANKPVYILPGASHAWPINAAGSVGEHLHLSAQGTSGEVLQADMVVGSGNADPGPVP
jgi:fimbrial chaperone protein